MLWVLFFKYSHPSQVQFKILVSTALSNMDMVSLFILLLGGTGDSNSKTSGCHQESEVSTLTAPCRLRNHVHARG